MQKNDKFKPVKWQLAYAARDLRHKKQVRLSCLKSDTSLVLNQLSSFSNYSPLMTKTIETSNPDEIFIEIVHM